MKRSGVPELYGTWFRLSIVCRYRREEVPWQEATRCGTASE